MIREFVTKIKYSSWTLKIMVDWSLERKKLSHLLVNSRKLNSGELKCRDTYGTVDVCWCFCFCFPLTMGTILTM